MTSFVKMIKEYETVKILPEHPKNNILRLTLLHQLTTLWGTEV